LGYDQDDTNNGLKVNHARAGKKTIGTARPGNSSGFFTDKGSETDIGIVTAANDRIEMSIWKDTIPFFLKNLR
jgi:hypothetical protein